MQGVETCAAFQWRKDRESVSIWIKAKIYQNEKVKNEETQKRGERGRQRQTDRQTDRVGYLPPLSFVPFYLLIPLCLRSQWWILWPEMSTNLKTISLGTVALVSLLSLESEDQRKGIQASTLSWMRGKECNIFLQETCFLSVSRLCEICCRVYLSATGQSEHCLPFSAHERQVQRLRKVKIMWFFSNWRFVTILNQASPSIPFF